MWVESSDDVKVGEPFTIQAHVNNESSSTAMLHSLDIGDSYLAGVSIDRTEPPFSTSEHIPVDNTVAHWFNLAVGPGEHLIVTLHATATRAGVQQGDFDICVNSEINCQFLTITTPVAE